MTDLDEWADLAELIVEDPTLLGEIRVKDPNLADLISAKIGSLAAAAVGGEWRDPRPGFGGRPEQLLPGTPGSFSDETVWDTYLIVGGRGSGKSVGGGQGVREMTLENEWKNIPPTGLIGALVGRTLKDVRSSMVEETLLPILPPGTVQKWNRGPCELYLWLPGKHLGRRRRVKLQGYSSEAPGNLRGPNHAFAWCDEVATWHDRDRSPQANDTTWSTMANGVRLKDDGTWTPRIIATTTPRPCLLLRNPDESDPLNPGPGLYDDPMTVRSSMSTLDNQANLADSMVRRVQRLKGTRLYDQEILGLLLGENEGSLWSYEDVQRMTVPGTFPERQAGGLGLVVVGVDPSIGAGLGDECGIVVAGLAADGKAYVLEDCSMRGPASEWSLRVARAFSEHGASAVVVESNQGGELVAETIGRYAPNLPITEVWAKKGKRLRAEPVQVMSQNGRVKLAGEFEKLTGQMRTWDPEGKNDSPDRLDAMVYAVLYLLPVDKGLGDLLVFRQPGRSRTR